MACRHGELDFTPMVGYGVAYIGLASYHFGVDANTIALPVVLIAIYQAVELVRNRNYRSIVLALPGLAIAAFGILATFSPTYWVVAGIMVSFIVTPSLIKVLHLKKKMGGKWLKQCGEPLSDWTNDLRHVRTSVDSALFTAVVSIVTIALMLVVQ